jgi:2-(3-amino-3-carboxypropyl)histidine synthase
LALKQAEDLNVDLIVHFGHSPMPVDRNKRVPVVYIETKATLRLGAVVRKALPLLKAWKRIGLVTTVQHADHLDDAKRTLLKAGKSVIVGDAGKLKYAGQVIGCDYSNATAVAGEVDCFLFVGGGRFHAIGVALATSKPVVVADPYEETTQSVDSDAERIRKQRWASIKEAAQSARIGILVGSKSGQNRFEKALQVSNLLKKTGKKPCILAISEVTPESLREFPTLDAYVNTACPRISLDDASRFHKPVLTVNEALVVAGEITWEQLLTRGWFGD